MEKSSDDELDAGVSNADSRIDHVGLSTLLVLRVLAHSKAEQSSEMSSNSHRVLTERILQKLSSASSAAKMDNIVSHAFAEVLQGWGRERALHSSLDPQDSTFDEALVGALQKHLDAEATQASPAAPRAPERGEKAPRRKSISVRLRKLKINIFKKVKNEVRCSASGISWQLYQCNYCNNCSSLAS